MSTSNFHVDLLWFYVFLVNLHFKFCPSLPQPRLPFPLASIHYWILNVVNYKWRAGHPFLVFCFTFLSTFYDAACYILSRACSFQAGGAQRWRIRGTEMSQSLWFLVKFHLCFRFSLLLVCWLSPTANFHPLSIGGGRIKGCFVTLWDCGWIQGGANTHTAPTLNLSIVFILAWHKRHWESFWQPQIQTRPGRHRSSLHWDSQDVVGI